MKLTDPLNVILSEYCGEVNKTMRALHCFEADGKPNTPEYSVAVRYGWSGQVDDRADWLCCHISFIDKTKLRWQNVIYLRPSKERRKKRKNFKNTCK